jgi:peptidyl-prolyl cis-trans isomerase D
MPVLVLLIFIPFVVSGIYGFTNFLSEGNAIAKVGGEPITQQELEVAQRERIDRLTQMLGPNVDPSLFDTPQARAATLDALLSERSLAHEIARTRLSVDNRRLQEVIGGIPQFQSNGHFDYDTYKALIAAQGMSIPGFEARLRSDLLRKTLADGVTDTALLPKTVADRLWALQQEKRAVRELRFKPEDFLSKASVGDDAIKAEYESNPDRFKTPEVARVEYLVLRPEDVASKIAIPEADAKSFYDKSQARWSEAEQRRASHILITAGAGGSAPDKAAARKLADELLARVRANPGSFAKLAQEYSKDPGSAEKGGDLGWFGRGMMVKPFEDAAFGLKEGAISDVVESDFGFHIIRVTGIKPASVKPFDQVRAQIENELRRTAAQKTFADTAEQFSNFVYEQSDGLKAAADKFQLQLQTVDGLTRQGMPRQPELARIFTPAVIDAVFSSDSLTKKRNSKAIEIGGGALVSARVLEYKPAAVQPLEQVRARIKAQLEGAAAARLARQAGEARLAELQKAPAEGASEAGFEATHLVGRQDPQGLPLASVAAIMAAPADKLPAYVGVDLAGGGYSVVRVLGVQAPDTASGEARQREEKTWLQQIASADERAYLDALRERFDAHVVRADLGRTAGKAADSSN